MTKQTHGKTAGGAQITDAMVAKLAEKAEAGYDVEETLRRRAGRPRLGTGLRGTKDCDIVPDSAPENLERLAGVAPVSARHAQMERRWPASADAPSMPGPYGAR